MVLEWSISEDLIGITGNVLGFMRVKSRHLESADTISAWNREFVLDTMNTGTSRSVDTPRSASYPVLSQLLVSHYTTAPSIVEGSQ